jgi:seryl-tRNA synthetase
MWESIKDWWFLISFNLGVIGASALFIVTTWLRLESTKKDLDDHLKAHAKAPAVMTIADCQIKGKSCSEIIQLQLNQGEDKFEALVQALEDNKKAIERNDDKNEKRHEILLTAILSIQGRHESTLSNMRSNDPVQKRIDGHTEEPTI